MLVVLGRNFKSPMINMLNHLEEKMNNAHKKIGNFNTDINSKTMKWKC